MPHSALRTQHSGLTPHCWQCGYVLTGLTEHRCPECGRPFDPADPTTMNLGKPMGRLARWMTRGVSRPITALFLLSTLFILSSTRIPIQGTTFSLVDLHHYAKAWEWKSRLKSLTPWDTLYMAGLSLLTLATLAWLMRTLLRTIAVWRYQPPRFQRRPQRLLHFISLSCMLLSTAAIGYGWPFRAGQRWAADEWTTYQSLLVINAPTTQPLTLNLSNITSSGSTATLSGSGTVTLNIGPGTYTGSTTITAGSLTFFNLGSATPSLPRLTAPQREVVLRSLLRQGPTPRDRLIALRIWATTSLRPMADEFVTALRTERDPSVRCALIYVLASHRLLEHIPLLTSFLDDANPTIRAAAIDAIGYIRQPAYQPSSVVQPHLNTTPPIPFPLQHVGPTMPIPPTLRPRLEDTMLHAPTLEEREAAARALVTWPPDNYQLRFAEWGVWSADATGQLSVVRAQFDSIPPFVHATANPAAEFADRVSWPTVVWKPVIHLTANKPLAVDLEVVINQGRPMYAYPKPDDFAILPGQFQATNASPNNQNNVSTFDEPTLPILKDLREGYPWLTPQHRSYTNYSSSFLTTSGIIPPPNIAAMGLRWQSLIVTPEKQPWMKEPAVPNEIKYNWWNACRNTNASWISNRGESEKFLYYDGPTRATTEYTFAIERNKLKCNLDLSKGFRRGQADAPDERALLFVKVADSKARGWEVRVFKDNPPDLDSPATPALETFRDLLKRKWLLDDEIEALIQTWKPYFFEKPGQRALLILSHADYNQLCPMTIRPTPQYSTRVGIIWHELP